MSSMAETEQWLANVVKWQENSKDIHTLSMQTGQVKSLTAFLSKLHAQLKNTNSVSEALNSLPQVGQLLGRLTTLPCLLLDESLYHILMRCVLFFYVDKPSCPVETRAKTWVLNQLHNMVQISETHKNMEDVMMVTGHKTSDLHDKTTQIVSASICSKLESAKTSPTLEQVGILGEINGVCLSFRRIDVFAKVLYSSLHQLLVMHPGGETDKQIEHLIDIQSCSLKNSQTPPLPYDVQTLLWTERLSSLEQEVLDLLEYASDHSITELTQKLINRHMIQACVEMPHIYQAVFDMLKALVERSNYHWKLLHVIHRLHSAIKESIDNHPGNGFSLSSIYGIYPSSLWPIKQLLSVSPAGVPEGSIIEHLDVICGHVEQLLKSSSTTDNIRFLLVCHLDWYTTALLAMFTCPKQNIPKLLKFLLCLYEQPDPTTLETYHDAIESLQCLYKKQHLTNTDLVCAVTSILPNTQHDGQVAPISPLIGQLLLVFAVMSSGGHRVLDLITGYVCNTNKTLAAESTWLIVDTATVLADFISLPREKIHHINIYVQNKLGLEPFGTDNDATTSQMIKQWQMFRKHQSKKTDIS